MNQEVQVKKSKQPIPVWLIGYNETEDRFFDPVNDQEMMKGQDYIMSQDIEDYVEYIKNSSEEYSTSCFYVCFPSKEKAIQYYLNNFVLGNDKVREQIVSKQRKLRLFKAFLPEKIKYIKFSEYFISTAILVSDEFGDRIKNIDEIFGSSIESAESDMQVWLVAESRKEGGFSDLYTKNLYQPRMMMTGSGDLGEVKKATKNGSLEKDLGACYFRTFSTKEWAEEVYYEERKTNPNIVMVPCIIPQNKEYFTSIDGKLIFSLDLVICGMKKEDEKEEELPSEVPSAEEEPAKEEEGVGEEKKLDKKEWKEWMAYKKHEELTPPWDSATSSITCMDYWYEYGKKGEEYGRSLTVEISDCRGKIRLHNRGGDFETFKNKVQTLIDNLQEFLDHLESCEEDGDSLIRVAKEKFPEAYD